MKHLLILLIILPLISIAQTQVSDIDYQLPSDEFRHKGFMQVGEEEYFIEMSTDITRISKVDDDELVLLHDLKYRPEDSSFHSGVSFSAKGNNSGFYYEGEVLYEIYSEYIVMTNIITAQLVDVVNLKNLGLKLQKDFDMGENYFFFKSLNGHVYVRLDRNTNQVEILDDTGLIQNGRRYSLPSFGNQLNYLDLETNQQVGHPYQFSAIQSITLNDSNPNSSLIIKDANGIHLLMNDDSIKTLNCTNPPGSQIWYATESILSYSYDNLDHGSFHIIDMTTCTELLVQEMETSYNYPDSENLVLYSDKQLYDEFFIYGTTNDWQGNGELYLYDIQNNEVALLEIPVDVISVNRSVRYDNNYYFLTNNHIHETGTLPELYRLNLKTYDIERISNLDIFETQRIHIGESQPDKEINTYYRWDNSASLLKIDNTEETLNEIESLNLYRNFGIHPWVYSDIWANGKYFFATSKGIFVMQNDETYRLPNIEIGEFNLSEFIQSGNFIYVLYRIENQDTVLKIKIDDLSHIAIQLDGSSYQYLKKLSTENAISNHEGFFDVNEELFFTYESLNLPNGTPEYQSGNNILYRTNYLTDYTWYLINTITKEVTLTEMPLNFWFDEILSDDLGGFYVSDSDFEDEVSFKYLNKEGKLSNVLPNFNHSLVRNNLSGDIKSLAFRGDPDLIIISIKDGVIKQKEIPQVYSGTFFWYESDNHSILQLYNGTNHDTYAFSYDTEAIKITPEGRDERLISVIEEDDSATLIYESDQNQLFFENYYYDGNTSELITEFQSLDETSIDDESIKIGNSKYLISFNDGLHGIEPWTYDSNTGELKLLRDINEGKNESRVSNFTLSPENASVYFTAITTEGDRQLFKVDELTSGVEFIKTKNLNLTLYPNPSNDYLIFNEDFKTINIYNLEGRLLYKSGTYNAGRKFNINNLPSGQYLIQGQSQKGAYKVGKFIVAR